MPPATAPDSFNQALIRQQDEQRLQTVVRDFQRINEYISWQIVKFLTLANGAGAIALLGFMGNSEALRMSRPAWAALFLFFLGIVLVGVMLALMFHRASAALQGLARDTQAWREGRGSFESIFAGLADRAGSLTESYYCGYGSFGAFIIGSLVAVIGI